VALGIGSSSGILRGDQISRAGGRRRISLEGGNRGQCATRPAVVWRYGELTSVSPCSGKEGELTLGEYIVHPHHRVQGVLMIHKGRVVFEEYPGMNPMDRHV